MEVALSKGREDETYPHGIQNPIGPMTHPRPKSVILRLGYINRINTKAEFLLL